MSKVVFLDGQFIPEKDAVISVADRAFMYGDGIFETLLVSQGNLIFWDDHWERFEHGAKALSIPFTKSSEEVRRCAQQLIERNQTNECLLRMQLSRGTGARGYSTKNSTTPMLVMTVHETAPPSAAEEPGWRLVTSSVCLPPAGALSACKTCNRLPQILAKVAADRAGVNDALLVSFAGEPLEASAANLFWISNGNVYTPPVTSGVLPGVTRRKVLGLCARLGVSCFEQIPPSGQLHQCDGIFCTLTTLGLVPVVALDGKPVPVSPIASRLSDAYRALMFESRTRIANLRLPSEN